MPRPVHFEIHADRPERAVAFYQQVFDWDIQRWEGSAEYWLVTTGPEEGPGINGAIMPRVRGGSTYNTIDVPSVEEYARKIVEAGGGLVMPRTAVPGVGYMAYCADTEGNVFGIMEVDETAE